MKGLFLALFWAHAPPNLTPTIPLDKMMVYLEWSGLAQGLSLMAHRVLKLTVPPKLLGVMERHFPSGRWADKKRNFPTTMNL